MHYCPNNLYGYLRYLVLTNQKDEIILSSSQRFSDEYLLDFIITNPINYEFATIRNSNFGQYVQIELKNKPFYLYEYSYKSHHLPIYYNMNWNFSVSKDNDEWIVVDSHTNDDVLKSFKEEKFKISKPGYYKFFRLTNTGYNYYNDELTTESRTILYVAHLDLFTNKNFCFISKIEQNISIKCFSIFFIFIYC